MAQKDQKLRITFFIAYLTGASVLLLIGLLAYHSMKLLIDKSKWVNHTNQVLLATEPVLSLLKDAESGQRGYSLTKDSTYLEPYLHGIDSVEYYIITLQSLTQDNPTQQARIPAIRQAVHKKIDIIGQAIDLTNTHPERLNAFYQSKVGKQRMDQVRHLLFTFGEEEKRLLSIRTGELDQSILRAQYSIYWIIISYVLIVLLTFTVVKYLLRKREEYENQLTLLNQQLQRTNQELAHTNEELLTTNEELLTTNERLHRSNSNLEEFAYVASHDLKEPIRKIKVFGSQLRKQLLSKLSEVELQQFDRILSAADRMTKLVDDLLQYSHMSLISPQKEAVDLNQIICQVLEDLELHISDKEAVIQVANLPVVQGYGRQLQQLFQNLISNALKYSKKNVPPQIEILSSQIKEDSTQFYQICIKDNGIGFAQQDAEKIFGLFTRLHGKSEYSGTGIGLSIVKKVVDNHNGKIWASSKEEQGSTFYIKLPLN